MLPHPFFREHNDIGHLVTSNFVNKLFVISRLITKFTKIMCHENLEQYGLLDHFLAYTMKQQNHEQYVHKKVLSSHLSYPR